jgi:hypothetical protein
MISRLGFLYAIRLAALLLSFVREQADGVLSCAAVPRGGLWPPTPPLCRYAEYTADLIMPA